MILISLAVVFAMVGVVSAANGIYGYVNEYANIQYDGDDQATGSTNIQYDVAENYTVTIPSDVTFNGDHLSGSGTVAASNVLLKDGNKLNVTMSSDNRFNLTYGTGIVSSIPYTIKVGGNIVNQNSYPVLTVLAGAKTGGSVTLTFETTKENIDKATKSGIHKDTLTFTCDVVRPTNNPLP